MGSADDRSAALPPVVLCPEVTVALDVPKLRKLVALDENDPLSRFALGKKLFETETSPEALREAATHLQFANTKSPQHLATYHIPTRAASIPTTRRTNTAKSNTG
jgi:hypothetical protein